MQNPLLINSDAIKMSSREIAELTDKRHDNVLAVIRKLHSDQILTPEIQETEYKGRKLPVYYLDKRDSLVLVARLSPEFTAAVVDRWQQLENTSNDCAAIPQTYPEALRLAADQAEQLALQAPKVEAFDNLIDRGENLSFVATSKLIGGVTHLKQRCRDDGMLNIDNTPRDYWLKQGYFTVKVGTSKHGHGYKQTLVTPRGQEMLRKRYKAKEG